MWWHFTLVSTLAPQRNEGVNHRPNALWQGWSRRPEATVASHRYNFINADSISAIRKLKTGSQECDIWRNHMWADESLSQQPSHVQSSCCWLHCILLSPEGRFISIHVHALSAAAAAARTLTEAERAAIPSEQLPLPLNYSSRLLVLMERQWREPGHSAPQKHIFMSYSMWGNWQA